MKNLKPTVRFMVVEIKEESAITEEITSWK
jgi:hypothetical protein